MVSSADVIVHAAAKLTEALKDNSPTSLTACSIEDVEKLAHKFHQIWMQISETQAATPRVQNAQTPRVQAMEEPLKNATALREVTTHMADQSPTTQTGPNYISDNEDINDDNEEIEIEEQPRYVTRQQLKWMNGSVTKDVMLTLLELNAWQPSVQQLATRKFPMQFLCKFAGAIMDEETGDMLEYRHLVKIPRYQEEGSTAFGMKIRKLAQGLLGIVEGTKTLFFIPFDKVPEHKRKNISYVRICTDYRPEKMIKIDAESP
jgi:hypothetical protein